MRRRHAIGKRNKKKKGGGVIWGGDQKKGKKKEVRQKEILWGLWGYISAPRPLQHYCGECEQLVKATSDLQKELKTCSCLQFSEAILSFLQLVWCECEWVWTLRTRWPPPSLLSSPFVLFFPYTILLAFPSSRLPYLPGMSVCAL